MLRMLLAFALLSTSAYGQGKTVLNFERGEISPALASSIEKTAPGQYTLQFNNSAVSVEKVKAKLQSELKDFPQLRLSVKGRSIVVEFKGPDTYLLKALSKADVSGS